MTGSPTLGVPEHAQVGGVPVAPAITGYLYRSERQIRIQVDPAFSAVSDSDIWFTDSTNQQKMGSADHNTPYQFRVLKTDYQNIANI